MEKELKKLNFSIGIFDELSKSALEKIKNESKNCEVYGVGVYTDKVIIQELMTSPTKSLEERLKIAENIPEIDFTFPVDTTDISALKKIVEQAYLNYIKNKNNK